MAALVGDEFQTKVIGGIGRASIPATKDNSATRGLAIRREGGELKEAHGGVVRCIVKTFFKEREPGRLQGHSARGRDGKGAAEGGMESTWGGRGGVRLERAKERNAT